MDLVSVGLEVEAKVCGLMESSDDWKVNKATDQFTVESKPSTDFEGTVYRAKCTLNAPFDECFKYININGGSSRFDWDSDIRSVQVLQQINPETQLQMRQGNSLAMGLISPRDFVDVVKTTKTDNVMQFSGVSVALGAHPPTDKFVRGWTYPSGVRVVKDENDSNKCHITSILQLDFKGKLPKSLIESSMPSIQISVNKNYLAHLKKVGVMK